MVCKRYMFTTIWFQEDMFMMTETKEQRQTRPIIRCVWRQNWSMGRQQTMPQPLCFSVCCLSNNAILPSQTMQYFLPIDIQLVGRSKCPSWRLKSIFTKLCFSHLPSHKRSLLCFSWNNVSKKMICFAVQPSCGCRNPIFDDRLREKLLRQNRTKLLISPKNYILKRHQNVSRFVTAELW